ncbi:hypothetical protein CHLRE_03g179350v5 [Chlamydomonas reinhardtii]|uniref:Major facilitator superfamily (MFS) profile domain-containing protein n=1 Tax=Chlamydomonas reinhardtii TaxID=3055 RepID=A0A2K3DXM1_CHLRE|nr:uncharacterized protein CHLRE_03g179350v5 [Chlamydomonas reinhardtii]PNW85282.1 hypothetical protein CHLRE_03g179350v5 [Chlamydomonas reinhardtii]
MLHRIVQDPQLNAKAWYVFYFASIVSVGPFLNVFYAMDRGLGKEQVGLIGALRPWVSAPAAFAWAALADRLHAHQAVLLVTFVGSTAVRLLLLLPRDFGGLLAVTLLAEVLSAPVGVMADAAVMNVCDKESDYGKFRLWGAVGWGAFSTPAGWIITRLGIQWAFYTNTIMSLPCIYFGARLKHSQQQPAARKTAHSSSGGASSSDERGTVRGSREPAGGTAAGKQEESLIPLKADPLIDVAITHRSATQLSGDGEGPGPGASAGDGGERGLTSKNGAAAADSAGHWRRLWVLVRRPEVAVFFVTAMTMGYGFGTIDSFLFLYLRQMGASETLMGLTLTITCAAEVPAFQLQDRLLDRWGVTAVLDLTMLVYALRLALYALLPYAGSVLWVLPVEVLHGVTFACGWGAGTVNCKTLAPPGLAATMQGAFQGLYFGAGYGLGSLVGGWVGGRLGWQLMFATAASVMFGLWLCVRLARWVLGVSLSGRLAASGYVELSNLAVA